MRNKHKSSIKIRGKEYIFPKTHKILIKAQMKNIFRLNSFMNSSYFDLITGDKETKQTKENRYNCSNFNCIFIFEAYN